MPLRFTMRDEILGADYHLKSAYTDGSDLLVVIHAK